MTQERIASLVEPILASHGLELDHLEVVPAGRRSMVRVTVDGDGPHGRGPLLDDIASASHEISQALDDTDTVKAQSYTLEVSSRGLSSPLTETKHYRRNLTRLLRVTTADGRTLEGRLTGVDEAAGTIDLEVTPESVKGNRNPKPVAHTIAIGQISRAVVQVELNRSIEDGFDLDDDLDDEDDDEDPDEDEVGEDDLDDDDLDGDDPEDDHLQAEEH